VSPRTSAGRLRVSRLTPAKLLVLAAASFGLGGCALPAFIHDKTIGPISPAGHVHSATVGEEFNVTVEGIQTKSGGEWWFRPYPRNFMARVGRPQSFWFATKGIHAFFFGLSPLVMRDSERGVEREPVITESLQPTKTSAKEVLARLGPPQLWLKRKSGSLMAYRADKGEVIAFWIGTPPFIDIIPGANNLSFRYLYRRTKPYKTVLFFDAEDRLLGVADNTARMRGDEPEVSE
jgi:hypothetical protein